MVDMELDKAKKPQLDGCAILDCDNVKNLVFKDMDGKIMHHYCNEVEDALCIDDLEANNLSVSDYIDADEEMTESLNDSEIILVAECDEI